MKSPQLTLLVWQANLFLRLGLLKVYGGESLELSLEGGVNLGKVLEGSFGAHDGGGRWW